jgi:hypothetical protein
MIHRSTSPFFSSQQATTHRITLSCPTSRQYNITALVQVGDEKKRNNHDYFQQATIRIHQPAPPVSFLHGRDSVPRLSSLLPIRNLVILTTPTGFWEWYHV